MSSHQGGGLRAWQLALRTNRNKPQFFQAGTKTGKLKAKKDEQESSLKKGIKRKRGKQSVADDAADEMQAKSPSPSKRPTAVPAPSTEAKKGEKRWKAELMVIEEGDNIPDEHEPLMGHVVWAPFGSFNSYYPAVVIKGSMVNLTTADDTQAFVFWFSDSKVSAVPRTKLMEFVPYFKERGAQSSGKRGQQGIIKAIEELQRCAAAENPSLMNMDPLKWAGLGFPAESSSHFTPASDFQFPDSILERLAAIGTDIRQKASQMDRDIRNEFHGESAISAVWQGKRNIADVCISCADCDRKVTGQHPMFEGGLCSKCKESLQETCYAVGEDGTHSFCAICGAGGQLFVCDSPNCGRVYCVPCVEELGGEHVLRKVKEAKKWPCFLCQPFKASSHGLLKPQPHWQENLILFFDVGHRTTLVPDLDYFKVRRPIRVLSLFDGIGTGLLALQNAGLIVEVYYASETDEQAAIISQANHGGLITQLGDVVTVTKERLAEIAPIDLLIGGSPCNELSLANPLRRGFDVEGSGVLFFDFYRILRDLVQLNGDTHLFWLYENVASMRTAYRTVISRFLQCQPAVWDAKHLSAQKRSRFFWGNIPGLYSTPELSEGRRQETDLNSVLTKQCDRQATVHHVRTITTQSNSLLQGVNQNALPVNMAGGQDMLWLSELERLFGFPAHYTDVGNLPPTKRRALLGRSWSVQVVTEILSPLTQYFATTNMENVQDGNAMPVVSTEKELSSVDSKTSAVDETVPTVSHACHVSCAGRASEGAVNRVEDFDRDLKLFSTVCNKSTVSDPKIAELSVGEEEHSCQSSERASEVRKAADASSPSGKDVNVASVTDVARVKRTEVLPAEKKKDITAMCIENIEVSVVQLKDVEESVPILKNTDVTACAKCAHACSVNSEDTSVSDITVSAKSTRACSVNITGPSDGDGKESGNISAACASKINGTAVSSAVTDTCRSGNNTMKDAGTSGASAISGRNAAAISASKDQTLSQDKANKEMVQSKAESAVVMSTSCCTSHATSDSTAASIVREKKDACGSRESAVPTTKEIQESRIPPWMDAVSDTPCGDAVANVSSAQDFNMSGITSSNNYLIRPDPALRSDNTAKDVTDQPKVDSWCRAQARCNTRSAVQNVSITAAPCQELSPLSPERKIDTCISVMSPEMPGMHNAKNALEKLMGDVPLKNKDLDVDASIYQAEEFKMQTGDDLEGIHSVVCGKDRVVTQEEDLDASDEIFCCKDSIIVFDNACDSKEMVVETSSELFSVTHSDALRDHDYHSTTGTVHEQDMSNVMSEIEMEINNHFPTSSGVTELLPQNVDSPDNVLVCKDAITGQVKAKEDVAKMAEAEENSHSHSLLECLHSGLINSHGHLFCTREIIENQVDVSAQAERQITTSKEVIKEIDSTKPSLKKESQHMNCPHVWTSPQEKQPDPVLQCASDTSDDSILEPSEVKKGSMMLQNSPDQAQLSVCTKESACEASTSPCSVQFQNSCLVPSECADGFLQSVESFRDHTTEDENQLLAEPGSTLCPPHVPTGVQACTSLLGNPNNTECQESVETRPSLCFVDVADVSVQQSEGEQDGREIVKHVLSEQCVILQGTHQTSNNTDISLGDLSSAADSMTSGAEDKQVEQISSKCTAAEKIRFNQEAEGCSQAEDHSKDLRKNFLDQNFSPRSVELKGSITKKYQTRFALKTKSGIQKSVHGHCSERKIADDKMEIFPRPRTERNNESSPMNWPPDTVHIISSCTLQTCVTGSVISTDETGHTAAFIRPTTDTESSAPSGVTHTTTDEQHGSIDPCEPSTWSCQLRSRPAGNEAGRKLACCGILNQADSVETHHRKASSQPGKTGKGTVSPCLRQFHGRQTHLYHSSVESPQPTAGFSGNIRQQIRPQQGPVASVCQQATSTLGLGQEPQQESASPSLHCTEHDPVLPEMAKSQRPELREQRMVTRRQSQHAKAKQNSSNMPSEVKRRSSKDPQKQISIQMQKNPYNCSKKDRKTAQKCKSQ